MVMLHNELVKMSD